MRTHWILALAFSLFLASATVVPAQSIAVQSQSAVGQVKHSNGKVISLGKTSLQSPKVGKTATPAAHSTPKQIINEPALMKLMYKTNAHAAMPRVEIPTSSKHAAIGFGGSSFTVNGLDNRDSRNA